MIDFALRAVTALIGALLLRGYLYPVRWRRRSLVGAMLALVGAALLLPLATHGSVGLISANVLLLLALLPYRRLAELYMSAQARAGSAQVARRWGGEPSEDRSDGGWEVVAVRDGGRRWMGNVLIHSGSLDPAVRRRETRYMLAFVIELREPPPFLCSLMIGWEAPRFFEREWRVTHVLRAEYLAADVTQMGIENRSGRTTGGDARRLASLERPPEELPNGLTAQVDDEEAFLAVFDPELCRRFAAAAARTYPYELNVTPTSVNIYTTYCGTAVQLANVRLLEELASRLEGG